MEEVRKTEGMSLEELETQSVELLPEREEMIFFFSGNTAIAAQGTVVNTGSLFCINGACSSGTTV